MARIGLLGGSFNPAHAAHRRISLAVIRALALDEVWWLVSPGNPLKLAAGMAPLSARVASARAMARRAPIRATVIEAALGTRYTVDTVRALVRRYPRHRFVWIMGADNLADFARWRDWRGIARALPIAVVTRPGYEGLARRGAAVGWLGRFARPQGDAKRWTRWSVPALVPVKSVPDPMSATARRVADPGWHRRPTSGALTDSVTYRALPHRTVSQEDR
ncbi:nicotinate-nucleotide adenylyltransferase [Sphingomonas sp.]|uniref:nicotinate-nucleotide adenylyltransferase n=1 Tax=Sphingomonas sp. TaxID=28214 RepID=UPI003AFFEE1C